MKVLEYIDEHIAAILVLTLLAGLLLHAVAKLPGVNYAVVILSWVYLLYTLLTFPAFKFINNKKKNTKYNYSSNY